MKDRPQSSSQAAGPLNFFAMQDREADYSPQSRTQQFKIYSQTHRAASSLESHFYNQFIFNTRISVCVDEVRFYINAFTFNCCFKLVNNIHRICELLLSFLVSVLYLHLFVTYDTHVRTGHTYNCRVILTPFEISVKYTVETLQYFDSMGDFFCFKRVTEAQL